MKKFVIVMLWLMFSSKLFAQEPEKIYPFPVVGKPCPAFILDNITHFTKNKASLEDFKGKWLFLDFWAKSCSVCVENFPHVNELQKEFKDQVQFLLVGINLFDKEQQTQPMYELFRKKDNLELPCAFDSTLYYKWGTFSVPHVVIIDPKGIVKAITSGIITHEQLTNVLNGRATDLMIDGNLPDGEDPYVPFNKFGLYLVNGNGGVNDSAFMFRSVLSKFNGKRQRGVHYVRPDVWMIDPHFRKGQFQCLGIPLIQLYQTAYGGNDWSLNEHGSWIWNSNDTPYYGKYFPKAIFDIRDSSLFNFSEEGETKGLYCYSVTVPLEHGTLQSLQAVMKNDLKNYFGFEACIEIRKMPCLNLVAMPGASEKLKSKGGPLKVAGIVKGDVQLDFGVAFQNAKIKDIIKIIYGSTLLPIFDETNIKGTIDLKLKSSKNNLETLKMELHKNGLDLVASERPMKVLVFRDPKPEEEIQLPKEANTN